MRFGTYFFLQAPPGVSHTDVVHDEFAQMVLSEALGYDSVWLTEHHFINIHHGTVIKKIINYGK